MFEPVEVLANAITAVSIALAGRRNVHTWWTGILACALFTGVFVRARLYADATLQLFFIITSILGWRSWARAKKGKEASITKLPLRRLVSYAAAGALVTVAYAFALERYTDAAAPVPDAAVLATSVLGQLLLVDRRIECWYFWLTANTISVPLYISRGLYVTAALYAAFWLNAVISMRHWHSTAHAAESNA